MTSRRLRTFGYVTGAQAIITAAYLVWMYRRVSQVSDLIEKETGRSVFGPYQFDLTAGIDTDSRTPSRSPE